MMDPDNNGRDYREAIEEGCFSELQMFFEERYEKKIDHFEERIYKLVKEIYNPNQHPDKTLTNFDKAQKYLEEIVEPFYLEKEVYYGSEIMESYYELEDLIGDSKQEYMEKLYDKQLVAYEKRKRQKSDYNRIRKDLLALLEEEEFVKKEEFMNRYPRGIKQIAWRMIGDLVRKKKIIYKYLDDECLGPVYIFKNVK